MAHTTSNLQIRTPVQARHGLQFDSESGSPLHDTQAARTGAGRRKRVKMHDPNVARFLDIEAEVSEDEPETGSSGGGSDSDSDNGLGAALCN